MDKITSNNLDSNESAFFSRELEYIKTRTYDKLYPELKATRLFPVSTEAGAGANEITYQQFENIGMGKIIADYADDLPRADVKGKEFTSKVRSIGQSYGYSIQDIRASMMAGRSLPQRKAESAKRANDQVVEGLAWNGSAKNGILGIFSNPNISAYTAPNGASPVAPQWAGKTAIEILKDLNDAVSYVVDLTNGVEIPDTIILPIKQYSQIQTTKLDIGSDTTILQFFLSNNPSIKKVEWDVHCKGVDPLPSGGSGPFDVMLVYKNDSSKLTLEIPKPFEAFSPQERNLEFVVPTESRCGGVVIYYPLSVLVVEKI